MLNATKFKKLFPNCKEPDAWVAAMLEVFPKYEINTKNRIAAFIAQCGHESGGWTVFAENLNYSAEGLVKTFGKYFGPKGQIANPTPYARKPEMIANVVYASRMGNGDTASGEGYKYRGRGPIQLTGKDNYTNFSKAMGVDAVTNPDLLLTDKKIALMAAIWFWNKNKLNVHADKGDIKSMTKIINGGFIGLEDRIKHYDHAIAELSVA